MTLLNPPNVFKAMLASVVLTAASASAAPILSDPQSFGASGAEAPLFSHMRHTVAILGDDNSITISQYTKGPWSKNEFLRAWEDIRGKNVVGIPDFVPIPEQVSRLPEPSTFALLGLGLLAFGVVRRRQTKR